MMDWTRKNIAVTGENDKHEVKLVHQDAPKPYRNVVRIRFFNGRPDEVKRFDDNGKRMPADWVDGTTTGASP